MEKISLYSFDKVVTEKICEILKDTIIEYYGLSDWQDIRSHFKQKENLDITKYQDLMGKPELLENRLTQLLGNEADILFKIINYRIIVALVGSEQVGNFKNLLSGTFAELINYIKQMHSDVNKNF